MKIFVFILTFSLLFSYYLYAQHKTDSSIVKFTGKVVAENNKVIPFAHIINLRDYKGTISDTLGLFILKIKKTDTLLISAIGYEDLTFRLPLFLSGNTYISKIVLKQKYYEIPMVTKYLVSPYEKFKEDFKNLKLPEEKLNPALKQVFPKKEIIRPEIEMPRVGSPISLIYRWTSEEATEIRKAIKYKKAIKKNKTLNAVLKKERISNLTGLKGEELDKFVLFCNFSKRINIQDEEVTILKKIVKCLEEYKKNNKDLK